jgi:hypothetical protein
MVSDFEQSGAEGHRKWRKYRVLLGITPFKSRECKFSVVGTILQKKEK